MSSSHPDLPIDETSRLQLAGEGLTLDLVDPTDAAAYEAWLRAETRGFLDSEPTDARIAQRHAYLRDDRLIGVWDATVPVPERPVATTICWPADLTVPGRRSVPAWAISGVTVSPTHRRRGIARALIEAELRTASALGHPVAMLTVSESTIYSRFGFSPAALARDITVLTRRARWTGPAPEGRVHFVSTDDLLVSGHRIVERVRLETPGQISYSGILWDRQLGMAFTDDDNRKNLRCLRYDDADGTPQGFAVYQMVEDPADFSNHTLTLHTMVTATHDAYAGLWRHLLDMDLVSTITAHLRPVDEPLRWLIDDFRAVRVSELDHLWVRVLDVPAALQARTYETAGRTVLTVTDPLGFADGTWALDVDPSGTATVGRTEEPADVTMTVNALGSLLLGGAPARTLSASGSLHGDPVAVDATFHAPVAPYLSIWF